MDVSTYGGTHVSDMSVYVFACMWKPKVGIKYLPGTLFIWFVEAGSLTELRAHGLELV